MVYQGKEDCLEGGRGDLLLPDLWKWFLMPFIPQIPIPNPNPANFCFLLIFFCGKRFSTSPHLFLTNQTVSSPVSTWTLADKRSPRTAITCQEIPGQGKRLSASHMYWWGRQ